MPRPPTCRKGVRLASREEAAGPCQQRRSARSGAVGNRPGRAAEFAIKEIAGRVIRAKPGAVQQKIVDLIGKNELFDVHAARAKARDEIDRLREVDVAVVV